MAQCLQKAWRSPLPPPANCSCLQKPLPLSAQFREREPVRICELGYSDFNKFEKARTLKVGKCKSKTISNRSSEQASAQSFFAYFLRAGVATPLFILWFLEDVWRACRDKQARYQLATYLSPQKIVIYNKK